MTNLFFRNALLVCFAQAGSVFFCSGLHAQATSEIGIGLGATNYRGEISPRYQWQNNRPAVTAFYRRDVSAPITLRGNLLAGLLRAADSNVEGASAGSLPLLAYRQANTKGWLAEGAALVEYNFRDYHQRTDKVHFTPYLFAGLALFYAKTTTATNNAALAGDFNRSGGMLGFAIPAGVGLKYALSTHLNLGLEMGARKAFTDRLDHLYDQSPLLVDEHTRDWYYFGGISLSYTFYKIVCPSQYKSNDKLLK